MGSLLIEGMHISMKRIGQELVEKWKELLAKKLGRSIDEIERRGLSATDFSLSQEVVLTIPGELDCRFKHAFCVVDEEERRVAVFTEHSGYHEFYLAGMKVSEVSISEYWDSDYKA